MKKLNPFFLRELTKLKVTIPITVALILAIVFWILNPHGGLFKSNILDITPDSFDGTVTPIEGLPTYDPTELAKCGVQGSGVDWNLCRKYTVVYIGNYKISDWKQFNGGHIAIDIITDEGTNLRTIANGVVTKVGNQAGGFGKYVTIKHIDVPSTVNSDGTTTTSTLYSTYAHMSEISVEEGEILNAGDNIGKSGNTGFSTTPHLHFQIDNEYAPFKPYWPFTTAEATEAGLSFSEAVDETPGSDFGDMVLRRGLDYTINPMIFVQKNLKENPTTVETGTPNTNNSSENNTNTNSNSETSTNNSDTSNSLGDSESSSVAGEINEEPEIPRDPPVLNFEIDVQPYYYLDKDNQTFKIRLRDQYGEVFSDGFLEHITVYGEKSLITAENAILSNRKFDNPEKEYINGFTRMQTGKERLVLEDNLGNKYYSEYFEIKETSDGTETQDIDLNSAENSDSSSNANNDGKFSDLDPSHPNYKAVMFLVEKEVISGYPDGTFQAEKVVNKAEALKFIMNSVEKDLIKSGEVPFVDVDLNQWYGDFVRTGYLESIVHGNPDGTFLPAKEVNSAELFKMLLLTMKLDIRPADEDEDWYNPYIEIIDDFGISRPGELSTGMTRGEVAQAMYELILEMQ